MPHLQDGGAKGRPPFQPITCDKPGSTHQHQTLWQERSPWGQHKGTVWRWLKHLQRLHLSHLRKPLPCLPQLQGTPSGSPRPRPPGKHPHGLTVTSTSGAAAGRCRHGCHLMCPLQQSLGTATRLPPVAAEGWPLAQSHNAGSSPISISPATTSLRFLGNTDTGTSVLAAVLPCEEGITQNPNRITASLFFPPSSCPFHPKHSTELSPQGQEGAWSQLCPREQQPPASLPMWPGPVWLEAGGACAAVA